MLPLLLHGCNAVSEQQLWQEQNEQFRSEKLPAECPLVRSVHIEAAICTHRTCKLYTSHPAISHIARSNQPHLFLGFAARVCRIQKNL